MGREGRLGTGLARGVMGKSLFCGFGAGGILGNKGFGLFSELVFMA
jgi:hypothetical protein